MSIYPDDPDKQRMVHITWICAVIALACLVLVFGWTGCADSKETVQPAGSSSIVMDRALLDAQAWALRDPTNRSLSAVAPTGSMLPVFGSNSVLLLEPATAADLRVGDIVLYTKAKGAGTICHRVREVSTTGVLFTGDNNRGTQPDGWIAAERIRWRVAGILYTRP